MTSQERYSDVELAQRYTDQPARLPDVLRAEVQRAWGGEPILGYALADLDANLLLTEQWVLLGPRSLAILCLGVAPEERLQLFARVEIAHVSVEDGLSCRVLRLGSKVGGGALALLRYTQRQRRTMDNLVFVLEQALEGREVPLGDPDAMYLTGIVQPIRDAQALVVSNELAVVWRLLGYLRPYRGAVMLGMSAAAGITLLALVPPLVTGLLVDRVVGPVQRGEIPVSSVITLAWLAIAGVGVSYVVRQLCVWIRLRFMAVIGENVARDLRSELYAHLHRLSMSFFARKKTGSLITRASSDTDRLWDFLAFGVVEVSLSLLMLVGLGAVLCYLDWRLGLVMIAPVPLFLWAIVVHGRKMNRLFLRAWRKWSRVTDVLSDTIPGMRVVKAFNQEARERARFDRRNQDAVREFNQIHGEWTSFWPLLMFGVQATIVLVWVLALPRLVHSSEAFGPPLSLGAFISFVLYMTMFVQPIEVMGQVARIMNRATSSAHRVFEVLDTEPEIAEQSHPKTIDRIEGRVQFEEVAFAYDGARQVIHGVSFDVQPGELIGLVGPSGGGKTTLTNLLTRFYDVGAGRILIDGVDVRELDAGQFRQQVGMVLQEAYLFHGTIADNIRYGMPEAGLDRVVEAARAANAHDFICKLPQGYETAVGERGHTLSGGERQRISIARAILKDPRILILDEATSAVDTETERRIQQAMDRLVQGRTVFAIAHRLSTLHKASRLFVIEQGRLVECGTHAELIQRSGSVYRRLYELQHEAHRAA